MAINTAQQGLTPDDVTSLCNAADAAWNRASNSAKKVKFEWRNKHYQSRLTNFRILVETSKGVPVACRYF